MSQRDLVSVALKVLGVDCAAWAMQAAPQALFFLLTSTPRMPAEMRSMWAASGWVSLLDAGLLLALAGVLLLAAEGLARRLAGDEVALPPTAGEGAERALIRTSVRVMGVVFVVLGVRGLGNGIVAMIQYAQGAEPYVGMMRTAPAPWSAVVGSVTKILVGLCLAGCANGLLPWLLPEAPPATRLMSEEDAP